MAWPVGAVFSVNRNEVVVSFLKVAQLISSSAFLDREPVVPMLDIWW